MRLCSVEGCNSKKGKELHFFHFPKDPQIRNLWFQACGKDYVNFKNGLICSIHFTPEDWNLKDRLLNTPIEKRKSLSKSAVPSLLIHTKVKTKSSVNKKKLSAKREREKLVEESIRNYELKVEKERQLLGIEEEPKIKSVAVQIDVDIECARELKIIELEKKLKMLEKTHRDLKKKCHELGNLERSMKAIFTNGQIERLKQPNKKLKWCAEDISFAAELYSVSPKAYRFLYNKNYPLPGISTVNHWVFHKKLRPKIATPIDHDYSAMNCNNKVLVKVECDLGIN